MQNVDEPVPLHVITGFLGSGKTTLLQRLLAKPELANTAVLINEFGEVGLDHRLIQHVNERVSILEGGCACCAVREDLRRSVVDLLAARKRGDVPPFERVVLETSGLADPAPILYTIQADYVLREYLRAGSVLTTVDGANGLTQIERRPEVMKQIAVADRVLITKADIATAEQVRSVKARVRDINATASFHDTIADEIGAGLLTDIEAADAGTPQGGGWNSARQAGAFEPEAARHGSGVRSFTLTYDHPVDWTAFSIWLTLLLASHGERVLRVKGILNVADSPTPVVIHGVQHIMHRPVHLPAWPGDDRRSHVVFIVDGVSPAELRASLDAFQQLGDKMRAGNAVS
jgi:G3E family GTPase